MPRKGGVPENLRPMKKGDPARSEGRPKGRRNISTYLKQFVEAMEPNELRNKPMVDVLNQLKESGFDCGAAALAYELFKISVDKKVKPETRMKAIVEITDRLEGKSLATSEVTVKQDAEEKVKKLSDNLVEKICDEIEKK